MEQRQSPDDLGPRGFKVFRTCTSRDDPMTGIEWNPPKESDELFEALRNAFPGRKTHRERMCEALMQFLAEELGSGSSSASSPEKPMNEVENSAIKAFQDTKTPVFRWEAVDQQQHVSSNDTSRAVTKDTSPNAGDSKSAPRKSGKDWDDMTVVWKSNVGLTKGARPRRMMTEEERTDYRMRRVRGACVSCKRKKRKCNHDPEPSPSSSSDTLTEKSISPPTPPPQATDKQSTDPPHTASPVFKQQSHVEQDVTVLSLEQQNQSQINGDANPGFAPTGMVDSASMLPLTGFAATDVLPFDFATAQYPSITSAWTTANKDVIFDAPTTFPDSSNEFTHLSGLDQTFVDPMMLGHAWNLENFDFDSFLSQPMAAPPSLDSITEPTIQPYWLDDPVSHDVLPLSAPSLPPDAQSGMKAFRSRVMSSELKKKRCSSAKERPAEEIARMRSRRSGLAVQSATPENPAHPCSCTNTQDEEAEPLDQARVPDMAAIHSNQPNNDMTALSDVAKHWEETNPQTHVEKWLSQKDAEEEVAPPVMQAQAKPQTTTEEESTQRRRVKFDLSSLIDGPPTTPTYSDEVSIDLIQATDTSHPDIRARQRPSFVARPGPSRSASRNSTASRLSFSDIMSISSAFTGMSIKDGATSRRSPISGGCSEVAIDDDEDDEVAKDDADNADRGCKPFEPMDQEWSGSGSGEDDSGSSEEGDDTQKVDWTEWNIQQTAATSVMHNREDLCMSKMEERIRKHLGDPTRKMQARAVKKK